MALELDMNLDKLEPELLALDLLPLMMLTPYHQLDLLPPMPLSLLMDLLGQVHQLGQLDQQVLSLHQLSQGKPLNQRAVLRSIVS